MKIENDKRYLPKVEGKLKEVYVFEVSDKTARTRSQKGAPDFGTWQLQEDVEPLVIEELKVD